MKIKKLNEFKETPSGIDDLTSLFVDTILDVAENSVARRLQVGCVFVKNNNIVGIGYNHTPFNRDQNCQVQDEEGNLKSKPWIYYDEDKDGVIHAEVDALRRLNDCGISPVGCTVYVTHECCKFCAQALADAKISEVFYLYPYKGAKNIPGPTGPEVLSKAGIPCSQINK